MIAQNEFMPLSWDLVSLLTNGFKSETKILTEIMKNFDERVLNTNETRTSESDVMNSPK